MGEYADQEGIMTENKHTPGPWSFYYIGDNTETCHIVSQACGHQYRLYCALDIYIAECSLRGALPSGTDKRAECEANAYLIAAAPELLLALELMLLAAGVTGENNFVEQVQRSAQQKARAAIAKAKGE